MWNKVTAFRSVKTSSKTSTCLEAADIQCYIFLKSQVKKFIETLRAQTLINSRRQPCFENRSLCDHGTISDCLLHISSGWLHVRATNRSPRPAASSSTTSGKVSQLWPFVLKETWPFATTIVQRNRRFHIQIRHPFTVCHFPYLKLWSWSYRLVRWPDTQSLLCRTGFLGCWRLLESPFPKLGLCVFGCRGTLFYQLSPYSTMFDYAIILNIIDIL